MGICVNEKDVRFVLNEVIGLDELLSLEVFQEFDKETIEMILSESQKLSDGILYEANTDGDKNPAMLVDGKVVLPDSYRKAWEQYVEGEWLGISAPTEYGGQGAPQVVGLASGEFMQAACPAFTMYPGLTRAGAELIAHAGDDWMKENVLPKLISGQWTATMCLTEPSAGSAVGDLKASAKKTGDGEYLVSGTKIFISSGEHELTEQIIHLVLARIEGAPKGIKGVSLFLIPKFNMDKQGNLTGGVNDVVCGGLEHKMGIKGNATATLNFGDEGKCKGWLVGVENEGIKSMFIMMNEARIGTGSQGHACGAAAYQHALRYAKERIQGTRIEDGRDPNAPRVEIIKHPDVRRMLLNMKSITEACRTMLYYTAYCEDMSSKHPDAATREKFFDRLELLTPICKAYCSDRGFDVTRDAIQTYGGYGYCSEYPVEQHMRDCKIASIYEGTNAIQSLDLIGRKVLNIKKEMRPYNDFMAFLREGAEKAKQNSALSELAHKVLERVNTIDSVIQHYVAAAMGGDMVAPILNSYPFLMAFGDTIAAFMLLWGADVAQARLDRGVEGATEENFYKGRVASAKHFIHNLLPMVDAIATSCKSGDRTIVELDEDCFV